MSFLEVATVSLRISCTRVYILLPFAARSFRPKPSPRKRQLTFAGSGYCIGNVDESIRRVPIRRVPGHALELDVNNCRMFSVSPGSLGLGPLRRFSAGLPPRASWMWTGRSQAWMSSQGDKGVDFGDDRTEQADLSRALSSYVLECENVDDLSRLVFSSIQDFDNVLVSTTLFRFANLLEGTISSVTLPGDASLAASIVDGASPPIVLPGDETSAPSLAVEVLCVQALRLLEQSPLLPSSDAALMLWSLSKLSSQPHSQLLAALNDRVLCAPGDLSPYAIAALFEALCALPALAERQALTILAQASASKAVAFGPAALPAALNHAARLGLHRLHPPLIDSFLLRAIDLTSALPPSGIAALLCALAEMGPSLSCPQAEPLLLTLALSVRTTGHTFSTSEVAHLQHSLQRMQAVEVGGRAAAGMARELLYIQDKHAKDSRAPAPGGGHM